jgi:hypothetical protein
LWNKLCAQTHVAHPTRVDAQQLTRDIPGEDWSKWIIEVTNEKVDAWSLFLSGSGSFQVISSEAVASVRYLENRRSPIIHQAVHDLF